MKKSWELTYREAVARAQETFPSKEEVRRTLLSMLEVNKDRMRRMSMADDSVFAYQNLALALACCYLEQEEQEKSHPLYVIHTEAENFTDPIHLYQVGT